MTAGHDRRSFLRELLRGATRAASEIESLRPRAEPLEPSWDGPLASVPDTPFHTVPAMPATRLATVDELRALCADLGRDDWADEAARLAQRSIRLTGGTGRSRLGGSPEAPTPFEWPVWEGEELAFLAQLHLAELPESALPRTGALLVFFALDRLPAGYAPDDAGACRVLHVADGPTEPVLREDRLPGMSLSASEELTLPVDPDTFEPDLWEPDPWEPDLWNELRDRLASLQGVELEDAHGDYHALHRLLGHPDTFIDTMGADAELVSTVVDVGSDPSADEPVSGADWRMLLQISNDDEVGIALGAFERLFVWIRDDDLRAGRFDATRAFVR
jgi:Domain of unknown function (DUF1963)